MSPSCSGNPVFSPFAFLYPFHKFIASDKYKSVATQTSAVTYHKREQRHRNMVTKLMAVVRALEKQVKEQDCALKNSERDRMRAKRQLHSARLRIEDLKQQKKAREAQIMYWNELAVNIGEQLGEAVIMDPAKVVERLNTVPRILSVDLD